MQSNTLPSINHNVTGREQSGTRKYWSHVIVDSSGLFFSFETSHLLKGVTRSDSACRLHHHNLCKELISNYMNLIDTKANNNPQISAQHELAASLHQVFAAVGMWLNHSDKFWLVPLSKAALRETDCTFFLIIS